MKALCINGSPRTRGSTACILENIQKGLEEVGVFVKYYCLGEVNINYCKGCKECYKEGICIQHDDMDKIIADFKESDIVVIGTPDYWSDVSGQLKVFFDRCTPYANTNANRVQMSKKRYGISVSVREGTTERENTVIVNSIEHFFGHMEVEPIGKITVTQTSNLEDLVRKHREKIVEAYQLGKDIHNRISG